MLCYEKHIKFFSWDKVLEPLINGLRSIEKDGIVISVADKTINFVSTVVAVII